MDTVLDLKMSIEACESLTAVSLICAAEDIHGVDKQVAYSELGYSYWEVM